ncbi:aldehyde-activating protein [Blastomonas aquatica]|uniref:Aldehyde-activating protein n=1 Tax=Blastomonas aquatica TaxID=1510276 RepID=A0ABQ1J9E9_9SPHN|nr:aldehyde-activating protein [Blastomonas aquatica]
MHVTVNGGCHCGAVRFEADVAHNVRLLACNCSMCAKTGFQHLIVPHSDFRLLQGGDNLSHYRFGTGAAEHLFCRTCGIRSFYQPRSHPESWSIDFRCLGDGHILSATVENFDGKNWESARASLTDDE